MDFRNVFAFVCFASCIIFSTSTAYHGAIKQAVALPLSMAHAELKNALPHIPLSGQLSSAFNMETITLLTQIENALSHGQQNAITLIQHFEQAIQALSKLDENSAESAKIIVENLLMKIAAVKENKKYFTEACRLNDGLKFHSLRHNAMQTVFQNVLTDEQTAELIKLLSTNPALSPIVTELTELVPSSTKAMNKDLPGFWDLLTTLIGLVGATAENTYVLVHSLVSSFIEGVVSATGLSLGFVGNQLLNLLRPFQLFLGNIYDQAVDAINSIIGRSDAARYLF